MRVCGIGLAVSAGLAGGSIFFSAWNRPLEVANAATAIQGGGSGGLSPELNYKQKAFENAVRGLNFAEGRVAIDEDRGPTGPARPGEVQAILAEGRRRLQTHGNVLGALSSFTEAILRAPDQAEAYVELGVALVWKKKTELAEVAFRTAIDLDESLLEARLRMAWLLNGRTRRDEAVVHWEKALDIARESAEAHAGLARSLYYLGRMNDARAHATEAARLGSPLPPHFVQMLESGPGEPLIVRSSGGPAIGPQVRVDVGGGTSAANETSIAAISGTGDEVVATWNDYRTESAVRMGVSVSLDSGATWSDFLVRPPAVNQSSVEGDPMTAYDHRTGTLWVGAISFDTNGGLYIARKQPGSTQFDPSVQVGQVSFADKGWMAAGPRPLNPNSTNLYIAYNEGLSRSTDMGATWRGPVSGPGGLGFTPRVGRSGVVYVAYSDFMGVSLYRSMDAGVTIEAPIVVATRLDPFLVGGEQVPGIFRVAGLPAFAVDPNDETLYCVFPDSTNVTGGNTNVDLYFTSSDDRGLTWSTPAIIGIDGANVGDQFFPWMEVDDAGTLHMVYYDTQNTVQDDSDVEGFLDAYYAYSTDDGASWTTVRLTSQPFNSRDDGRIGEDQFLGDYLGLAYAGARVYPCYLSTQNGDADIFVHTITAPPPDFGLSLTALVQGQQATLSVVGAQPNTDVVIHWTRGGIDPDMGPCPPEYGGLCLDLIGNVRTAARRTADQNGELSFTHRVPPTIPQETEVQVQLVNILGVGGSESVKSNFVRRTVR